MIEDQVLDALREVIDPELGVNIVDLGLVYGIYISGKAVRIEMTMTSPACPLSEHLMSEIETAVRYDVPGIASVQVDLVWEPAWTPLTMSPQAKQHLGWTG